MNQDDPNLVYRIQNAIDMLNSPLFIKDRNFRYIACNKAFEEYIGLPRAKIIGASVYDVAPPDLAAIYEKADRALLEQGGTQEYEANVRYADGSYHDVIFFKSVFYNAEGVKDGISGVILDITERKRMEKQLAIAATEDFLTGALNLRTFFELANQEFTRFKRNAIPLSILMIDLDHFKDVNDTYGHEAGDEALKVFGHTVKTRLREQDIFARAGGDEFRVLLPNTSLAGAVTLAEKIHKEVGSVQVVVRNGDFPLSMSCGVCCVREEDRDINDLVHRADIALYKAKNAGRNNIKSASC